jgi:hypothetical protein
VELKADGVLEENCEHRRVQYINNVLEQDRRPIKRRINASQHFRSFWAAWRTIAGYEVIHTICEGQAYGNVAGAKIRPSSSALSCDKQSISIQSTTMSWAVTRQIWSALLKNSCVSADI